MKTKKEAIDLAREESDEDNKLIVYWDKVRQIYGVAEYNHHYDLLIDCYKRYWIVDIYPKD